MESVYTANYWVKYFLSDECHQLLQSNRNNASRGRAELLAEFTYTHWVLGYPTLGLLRMRLKRFDGEFIVQCTVDITDFRYYMYR